MAINLISFKPYNTAAVYLSWQGYILYVNGRWSGEILPPEQLQTKLTGFNPGDAITVQLAAMTNDLPAAISALINQEGANLRYFPSQYEQPDSGVESSSSFLSKGPADETKQYACVAGPPLVIQYSNLVKTVSSLDVIKLGCRSASIMWSLDDTADRSVEPEVLSVLYWKITEEEESAIKQIVTGKGTTSVAFNSSRAVLSSVKNGQN